MYILLRFVYYEEKKKKKRQTIYVITKWAYEMAIIFFV